jgi:biotin carboxyl carrier protein
VSDQVPLETRVVEGAAAAPERSARSAAERTADHAAIAGSIDELLPALIAKLGATGLAELEVREDALRVRLRRPVEGSATHDRRAGDRGSRDRSRGSSGAAGSAQIAGLTPVGPGRDGHHDGRDARSAGDGHVHREDTRSIATSPAVGIYHPESEARAGTRVRAGDRLGTVDMLGVPQEVVAPTDGLIGASLVEPGDAVEYGQELVVIEFPSHGPGASGAPGAPAVPPAPVDH